MFESKCRKNQSLLVISKALSNEQRIFFVAMMDACCKTSPKIHYHVYVFTGTKGNSLFSEVPLNKCFVI